MRMYSHASPARCHGSHRRMEVSVSDERWDQLVSVAQRVSSSPIFGGSCAGDSHEW